MAWRQINGFEERRSLIESCKNLYQENINKGRRALTGDVNGYHFEGKVFVYEDQPNFKLIATASSIDGVVKNCGLYGLTKNHRFELDSRVEEIQQTDTTRREFQAVLNEVGMDVGTLVKE